MQNQNYDDSYARLANAIILQAVRDYRKALKQLSRNPRNKDAQIVKEECESFFRSGYFGALSEVDPEYLIRRLNEEVDK